MTIRQITEYLHGWMEDNQKDSKEKDTMINPSSKDLEMFNLIAGIARQEVPNK